MGRGARSARASVGVLAIATAVALGALAPVAPARDVKDVRPEVRAAGRCGAGATSSLRLRGEDGLIRVRFEVDHTRVGPTWTIAIVHERRVAFRGTRAATAPDAAFEVERRLDDLPGADQVTARAWGPNGLTCVATALLPA